MASRAPPGHGRARQTRGRPRRADVVGRGQRSARALPRASRPSRSPRSGSPSCSPRRRPPSQSARASSSDDPASTAAARGSWGRAMPPGPDLKPVALTHETSSPECRNPMRARRRCRGRCGRRRRPGRSSCSWSSRGRSRRRPSSRSSGPKCGPSRCTCASASRRWGCSRSDGRAARRPWRTSPSRPRRPRCRGVELSERDCGLALAGEGAGALVAVGQGEDLLDVPVGVVVGEDRAVPVLGRAGGAQVARGARMASSGSAGSLLAPGLSLVQLGCTARYRIVVPHTRPSRFRLPERPPPRRAHRGRHDGANRSGQAPSPSRTA
jgi:hypothetical protein